MQTTKETIMFQHVHGHVFTSRQKWIMVIKKEHGLVQEKRNALEEDRYAMECRIVAMVKTKTKICVQEIFVITDSCLMTQTESILMTILPIGGTQI